MSKDFRLPDYLDHMLAAAVQACSYVEGMDRATFLGDKRTQQAVILNIVVIGEVASKLLQNSAPFLDRYPSIPWSSMKGMRNRIAHGYFDIDLVVVWDTVQTALPQLVAALPSIRDAARSQETNARPSL